MYYILYVLTVSSSIAMTTPPTPTSAISELCRILGTSVDPSQEQVRELLTSLFALLEFGVNMASGMPNKWQYAPNGSVTNGYVMTVADLMSLFEDLMPSLKETYYGKQVCDVCASAIVNALWVLACTIDVLIQLAPSSPYKPLQALCVLSNALFCVQPREEDSVREDGEAGILRRRPARPHDYLGDVLNALTAIQKQGQ